jgi:hypothetical protein
MSPNDVVGRGRERDTQQENSYMKHAFRKRLPVTAMFGRVNEAS